MENTCLAQRRKGAKESKKPFFQTFELITSE